MLIPPAISWELTKNYTHGQSYCNKWIDLIQGGIGWKFSNKNPFATANTKISKWKCIPGVLLYLPSFLFPVFSLSSVMISHDANSSLHYAPQTNISIAYTSYPYPHHYSIIYIIILSSQLPSYHPNPYPIVPIIILFHNLIPFLNPKFSYYYGLTD